MNIKRKSAFFLFLFAVMAAGLFLYYGSVFAYELEKAVPSDASAVLFIDYVKDDFYLKCVNFFNRIASLDDKKMTAALSEKMGFEFSDPKFLATIAGVAAVFYDADAGAAKQAGGPSVALIIKMADKNAFMINLQNFKAAVSKNSADNEYRLLARKGSIEIEIVEKKDKSEYFAFIVRDDLLIGAFGADAALRNILKTLEVLKDEKKALGDMPDYKNALAVLSPGVPFYFYTAGPFVQKYAAEESLLPDLDYVKSVCFSLNFDTAGVTLAGAIITDKNNKNNAFTKYFTFEGDELKAPAMLDGDTMLYSGGRFHLDPKLIAEDDGLKEVKKQINENLGVDFEKDIMPWLAEEFFVAFSNYKALPLPVLPAPRIYFGIKSRDKAACEKCMQRMLPAFKLEELRKDSIAGVNYFFSPVPTPNNIMPEFGLTIAYVNDFLIFASSKDALMPLIASVTKNEKSLAAAENFVSGCGALLKSALFTVYCNNALLSEFILSMFSISPEYKLKDQEIDLLKAVKTFTGGFTFKDAALRFRFNLNLDNTIIDKIFSPEWVEKAQKNEK